MAVAARYSHPRKPWPPQQPCEHRPNRLNIYFPINYVCMSFIAYATGDANRCAQTRPKEGQRQCL